MCVLLLFMSSLNPCPVICCLPYVSWLLSHDFQFVLWFLYILTPCVFVLCRVFFCQYILDCQYCLFVLCCAIQVFSLSLHFSRLTLILLFSDFDSQISFTAPASNLSSHYIAENSAENMDAAGRWEGSNGRITTPAFKLVQLTQWTFKYTLGSLQWLWRPPKKFLIQS